MSLKTFIAISSAALFLMGCHPEVDDKTSIEKSKNHDIQLAGNASATQLIERLGRFADNLDEDGFVSQLNELKKTSPDELVIERLLHFWQLNDISDSKAREFFGRPRVRLEIANLLVQLTNNGRIGGSVEPYAMYAEDFVRSNDSDLSSSAVLLLGLANRRADVKVFEEILFSESENLFYSTSLALAMNCFVGEDRFNLIAEGIKNSKLRDHLSKVWVSYKGYREARCQK